MTTETDDAMPLTMAELDVIEEQAEDIPSDIDEPRIWILKRDIRRLIALSRRGLELENLSLKLCRELQCPAMEYLNEHVQNAWSELFNLVEPTK